MLCEAVSKLYQLKTVLVVAEIPSAKKVRRRFLAESTTDFSGFW